MHPCSRSRAYLVRILSRKASYASPFCVLELVKYRFYGDCPFMITTQKWIWSRYAARGAFGWEVPLAVSQARANRLGPHRLQHPLDSVRTYLWVLPTLFRSKRNLENDVSMRNVASSNAEERQFCRDNRPAAVGRGSEGLDAIILKRRFLLKSDTHFFINRTIRHEMTLRAATMLPMSCIFRSRLRIDGSFRQSTWRPPSARRLSKFY